MVSELTEHPAARIGRDGGEIALARGEAARIGRDGGEIALARGEAEAGGGDDGERRHEYRSGATVMVSCHDKHGTAALSPFPRPAPTGWLAIMLDLCARHSSRAWRSGRADTL